MFIAFSLSIFLAFLFLKPEKALFLTIFRVSMKSNWKRRYNQPAIITTSTGLAALAPQILLSVRIIWASSSQMRCISLGKLRSQSKHLAQGENSPGAIRRHHHIGEKLQALKIFHGGKVRRFFLHRPFSSFSFCGIFISSGQSSLIRTVSLTPKIWE